MGRSIRWASMAVAGLLLTGSAIPAAAGDLNAPPWTIQRGTTVADQGGGAAIRGTDVWAAAKAGGNIGWLLPQGAQDVVVMRTTPYGVVELQNRFGTNAEDAPYDITVGPSGAAYVVGYSTGTWVGQFSFGAVDAFVAKIRPAGTLEWVRSIGTSGWDRAWAVATDKDERVFVTGVTDGAFAGKTNQGGEDIWVRILTKDGDTLNTLQLGSDADDWANEIAVAGNGAFWIAGWSEGVFPNTPGNKGDADALLLAFNANAELTTVRRIASAGRDIGRVVALAGKGRVVVGVETDGTIGGGSGIDEDVVLRGFGKTGAVLWTRRFGGPSDETIYALQKVPNVGFMTAGTTSVSLDGKTVAGPDDAYVRIVGPTGLWRSTQLVGTDASDRAASAAVGPGGYTVLAGETDGSFPNVTNKGDWDFFLARP